MVVIIEVIPARMAIRKKLGRREIGKTGVITGNFDLTNTFGLKKVYSKECKKLLYSERLIEFIIA